MVAGIDAVIVALMMHVLPPISDNRGGDDQRKRGNQDPEAPLGRISHQQFIQTQTSAPKAHDLSVWKQKSSERKRLGRAPAKTALETGGVLHSSGRLQIDRRLAARPT
jgi:hypothetical protein